MGSDLETNNDAGTTDLNELIEGYNALSASEKEATDVLIAFGGAAKASWKGMKFATMDQIVTDGADGVYGDEGASGYLYTAEGAHMGDASSLKLYMEYVQARYASHEKVFMTLWDHGAAYGMFGNDDNFEGDGLTLDEIKSAFATSGIAKVDLLGYDSCLNGNIEMAATIAPYASYLMGSEELEPGHGWNWSTVLQTYAAGSDVSAIATSLVDNFVAKGSHQYEDTGKTLSVVDLAKFGDLNSSVDALGTRLGQVFASDSGMKEAVIYASKNSQAYGKSEQDGSRVSVDLIHFLNLLKKKAPSSDTETAGLIDNALTAAGSYVIHAREDGTRPNSNGVSIAPPEIKTDKYAGVKVNDGWYAMVAAFNGVKTADTSAPQVVSSSDDYDASQIQWDDDQLWEWYDGADADQYYEELFDGDYYETEGSSSPALRALPRPLPFMTGERAAFTHTSSVGSRALSGVTGTLATFADDNLEKIVTVYGNQIEDPEEGTVFLSTAVLEAFPTSNEGEYFTPVWNQKWYVVTYDPAEETAWMPMIFQGKYVNEGAVYTLYSSEIDYIASGKDYSAYGEEAFDYAKLEITVDANNSVVAHRVIPYKFVYSGPEDETGSILFDKHTPTLAAGDQIRFYSKGFDSAGTDLGWFPESDFITFSQAPSFGVEPLQFEDENGDLLPYYYSMRAVDIAGNGAMTSLSPAQNQ